MNAAQIDQLAERLLETNSPTGTPIGGDQSAQLIGALEAKGDRMCLLILDGKHAAAASAAREWLALRGVQVPA